ncbi:MAG: U32 family peptidase [Nanoarchaeota archaeon]|nr:U32 family peptidase [Nanoarchaeota archaeon]MBU1643870.1 U32 family peptidase [Nanoarchaeota archaeon]MBU1977219.1 U32 family peptidase [Nanoarchaeota archaeon]
MAPAGNFESLRAAIKARANSVYFGVGQLNMRARAANNFSIDDLKEIVTICKEHEVKTYLTLNIVLYDEDLASMKKICQEAKKSGVTAVIASDLAAIQYAHSIGLEVHLSTQANISNIEAVRFYAQFADVVILARELNLEQIKTIVKEIETQDLRGPKGNLIEIELFIHGALCVSISGKCYMSLASYNFSANRGECLQSCRRAYRIIDEETGDELKIENKYVMSPKDLCTISVLDQLLDTGIKILKIEGRGRSPEYVYTVVKTYREAVDKYLAGTYNQKKVKGWVKELETVFNRGFWQGGYYLGNKLGEWSGTYGSKATKKKIQVGIVKNYFSKKGVGEFQIEAGEIKVGDEISITGPTTGVIIIKVESIFLNERSVGLAKKGVRITIPVPEKIRPNDKLFVLV